MELRVAKADRVPVRGAIVDGLVYNERVLKAAICCLAWPEGVEEGPETQSIDVNQAPLTWHTGLAFTVGYRLSFRARARRQTPARPLSNEQDRRILCIWEIPGVIIGVPKEVGPGECRVGLVPANVAVLTRQEHKVLVEEGAGEAAGYPDAAYQEAGATLVDRARVFAEAELIVQVQTPGVNRASGEADLAALREGQLLIGMMDPLGHPEFARQLAERGVVGLAMELVPRITRAQAMDVLSSMAMLAGYKAVLLAASQSARMFPMSMTAAGTLQPVRAFVMGAGVAGLQACATAKRLGAVVEAYDVRPAAREQILSVGARPVELDIAAEDTESSGGYAREQSDEFLQAQRAAMAKVLEPQDVVITTAAIPGRRSPVLITADMVASMKPGAVIVDLAAERGGNCELTRLGEVVTTENGVTILGPDNVPATVAFHASQMFGKNIENLLGLLLQDGALNLDFDDEIIRETVVSHEGQVRHPRLCELLELPVPAGEPQVPQS